MREKREVKNCYLSTFLLYLLCIDYAQGDSDRNNNGYSENKNTLLQRRKESRKVSQESNIKYILFSY